MPNVPITCISVHHHVGENSHTSAYADAMRQSVTGPLEQVARRIHMVICMYYLHVQADIHCVALVVYTTKQLATKQ